MTRNPALGRITLPVTIPTRGAPKQEGASQMPGPGIELIGAEEIASAVVFLLSDRSAAITGQALDVNGGNWFR